jgi:hypothetical protein
MRSLLVFAALHETIEFAYGHGITNKTEAAYRRGTAVEKRWWLMDPCWTMMLRWRPAIGQGRGRQLRRPKEKPRPLGRE